MIHSPPPRVLIVILCHNGFDDTRACLESLRTQRYSHTDLLIVDNASQDGTPEQVRASFPEATVIETGANLGFAEGNNVGLRYAVEHGYEYVLLLNNDTEVNPDFLSELVAICEADQTIGIVGPKIYYYDRPRMIWSAGGGIDWARGSSYMRGIDSLDHGQYDTPAEVDFVTGCALLVRRTAFEQAGMLDPRFWMYYEETEWCVRVRRSGWRIVYVPGSRLWHKIRPARQAQSARIVYYMTRNRLLFLRLTKAPLRSWLYALIAQDLRTWWSWRLRRRWRRNGPQRGALMRGWRDFLLGRFGMTSSFN